MGRRRFSATKAVLGLARRMARVTAVYFCYGWTLWLYLAWIPSFFGQSQWISHTSSPGPQVGS